MGTEQDPYCMLAVRVPRALRQALRVKAAEMEVPMQDLILAALTAVLDRERTAA